LSESKPPEVEKGPPPGDSIIFPTEEERRAEQERQEKQRRYETENSYKQRQIDAAEAANDLARTNRNLTIGVIILSTVTAAASWYQGGINWHNWQTSNSTLQQMKNDAAESSKQFQVQLSHFDAGLGRTELLATHAGEQAVAAKEAATAAKSAAVTAVDTLHISQRAYITTGNPNWDIHGNLIQIPIINSGHIPSGKVETIVHTIMAEATKPEEVTNEKPVNWTWNRKQSQSIVPGQPLPMLVSFRGMDEKKVREGYQTFLIVGYVLWTDGFPKSAQERWAVCWISSRNTLSNTPEMYPCNSDEWLPKAEALDGYPKNEGKQQP
jgi:hypothetical protein